MSFYIFPPHPSSASKVRPTELDRMEASGQFVAQLKFNGGRAVLIIDKGTLRIWNRHAEGFANLKLTPGLTSALFDLNIKGDICVLDGEWLGSKAVSKITNQQVLKDTIVLFDVLYLDGHLTNMVQTDRLKLLNEICHNPTELEPKKRGLIVSNKANLWMAETFTNDFSYHYYRFYEFDEQGRDEYPEIEGLVLRKKNGLIQAGTKQYDTRDIIRCRKPGKRHGSF